MGANSPNRAQLEKVGYDAEIGHVTAFLETSPDLDKLIRYVQQCYARLDDYVQNSPNKPIHQCVAGCTYCCSIPVEVHPLETLALAEGLVNSVRYKDMKRIRGRISGIAKQISDLPHEEHSDQCVACGLLNPKTQLCLLYPWRPIACRTYLSASKRDCRQAYERRNNGVVPLDPDVRFYGFGVNKALHAAIQRKGLQTANFEFHSALSRALKAKNAAKRWLSGEDIFNDCKPAPAS